MNDLEYFKKTWREWTLVDKALALFALTFLFFAGGFVLILLLLK